MKKTNMAIARGTYTVLGVDKKQILGNNYDKGMTFTGPGMRAIIEEAANKANVSFDKVKVGEIPVLVWTVLI